MTPQVLTLSPLDQMWVLVTACLVFSMQAGFLCLEAGLSRAKHSMNVAVKNMTDFLTSSIAFLLIGYGLMFGRSWHGLVGTMDFFPSFANSTQTTFFLFQLMFCGCAATIVTGAVAERLKFSAYIVYSLVVSVLFYPLFGHWVWGGGYYLDQPGWLARLGYLDFAGSSVVHQMGGWLALAGIVVIGPRLGKFDAQGRPQRLIGHNIPLALLGVFILWLGWFGFNGGSTLHMNDTVAKIILNTNTAAAVGSLMALAVGWWYRKRPDIGDIANGTLGGLVAITASAAYVDTRATCLIGAVAGLVVIVSGEWLERGLKLDDTVGAVPVHGFCGLWGILAAGLLAHPTALLHPGNRLYHVGIQLLGSGVCFLVAFGGGWIFFSLLDRLMRIRVSPEAERQGLNVSEHQALSSIQQLAETMREIAQGKAWHKRTGIDPYADSGELGVHFNELLATIERTLQTLEAKQQLLTSSQESLAHTNKQLHRREQQLLATFAELQESHDILKRTHAQLVQAEKLGAIGQFASGVAHEVKNPLSIILQGVTYLEQAPGQDEAHQAEVLQMIRDGVQRANAIIRGLLEFAKPTQLRLAPQAIGAVMDAALELVRKQVPEKEIRVTKAIASQLPLVMVDASQMQQVFINLILNAFQATLTKGALFLRAYPKRLTQVGRGIGRRATDYFRLGETAVVCEVEDRGTGIPQHLVPKVFDPFFTTKPSGEGTGLGLAVTRSIVESHRALIHIDSEEGHGTVVRIILPIAKQSAIREGLGRLPSQPVRQEVIECGHGGPHERFS